MPRLAREGAVTVTLVDARRARSHQPETTDGGAPCVQCGREQSSMTPAAGAELVVEQGRRLIKAGGGIKRRPVGRQHMIGPPVLARGAIHSSHPGGEIRAHDMVLLFLLHLRLVRRRGRCTAAAGARATLAGRQRRRRRRRRRRQLYVKPRQRWRERLLLRLDLCLKLRRDHRREHRLHNLDRRTRRRQCAPASAATLAHPAAAGRAGASSRLR